MAEHHPEPTPIPLPPDFPVTWADPGDSHLPLMQDRQHAPSPITPLSGWVTENYWGKGASAGLAAAGQPISALIRRVTSSPSSLPFRRRRWRKPDNMRKRP